MRSPSEWLPILSTIAAVGSGIMAGLFFAFSNSVMRALSDLPPASGMQAMQRINVVIVNPLFLLVFLGTGVACLAVAAIAVPAPGAPGHAWFIAASLSYLVGVVGVTMMFNVPLNNGLERAAAQTADVVWPVYVTAWVRWNHVRAVMGVLATGGFAWGLFKVGNRIS